MFVADSHYLQSTATVSRGGYFFEEGLRCLAAQVVALILAFFVCTSDVSPRSSLSHVLLIFHFMSV